EHPIAADVELVGIRWRIQWHQRDIVATREQLDRQRVIARTAAAVHASGPRCDGENPHDPAGFTTFFVIDQRSGTLVSGRGNRSDSLRAAAASSTESSLRGRGSG